MSLKLFNSIFLFSAWAFSLGACNSKKEVKKTSTTKNTLQHIKVDMTPKSESSVSGTVRFIATDKGVRVVAKIKGLTPHSKHGFHIHEKPDCSAEDASSAGDHFNPLEKPHGAPDGESHAHAGDLGNLQADASGETHLDQIFEGISLKPADPTYVVNRSVVIHAQEDDLESQPAGDAGDRIACGAITL